MSITAQCLCGSVRISAKSASKKVGACHCRMCRRWGGGPLLTVDCGTDVSVEGQDNVGLFDSSQWAERGFCKNCGSHLFYLLKHNQQYLVPAGLLDGDDELAFTEQVFIDEKPHYYAFVNETEDMTGAEVFAKYAPK